MDETSKSITSKSTTSTFERRPPLGRVALVWRGDPGAGVPEPATTRHHLIFSALAALGVAAEPVLYSEEAEECRPRPPSRDGRRAGLGRPAELRQGPLAARSAAAGHRVPRRVGEHPSGRDFENGRQGGALPNARARLGYRHRPLSFGAGLRRAFPCASCGRRPSRPQAEPRERRSGRVESRACRPRRWNPFAGHARPRPARAARQRSGRARARGFHESLPRLFRA